MTELKCCPRKKCKGPAKLIWRSVETHPSGNEALRAYVICTKCGVQGIWGNAPGPSGEWIAREAWNGDWGRDEH